MTTTTSQFTFSSNGFFLTPEPSTAVAEMLALMDGNCNQHGNFIISVPFALVGGNRTEAMTFNISVENNFHGSDVRWDFADNKVKNSLDCLDRGDFLKEFFRLLFAANN